MRPRRPLQSPRDLHIYCVGVGRRFDLAACARPIRVLYSQPGTPRRRGRWYPFSFLPRSAGRRLSRFIPFSVAGCACARFCDFLVLSQPSEVPGEVMVPTSQGSLDFRTSSSRVFGEKFSGAPAFVSRPHRRCCEGGERVALVSLASVTGFRSGTSPLRQTRNISHVLRCIAAAALAFRALASPSAPRGRRTAAPSCFDA